MDDGTLDNNRRYTESVGLSIPLDPLINRNYVTTTEDCNCNHADVLHNYLNNNKSY